MDWLDLLAVQGTLKNLLQHHSSKASILRHSAFFIVQLSHSYMTTGKTIALTRWTFVGQVMSLLFNMLSRLVITFLPRSQRLLIGDVDSGQTPGEGYHSHDQRALSSVWPLLVFFFTVSVYPVYSSPPTTAHTHKHTSFLKNSSLECFLWNVWLFK